MVSCQELGTLQEGAWKYQGGLPGGGGFKLKLYKWLPRDTEQAVACSAPQLSYLSTGDKFLAYRTVTWELQQSHDGAGTGTGASHSLGSSAVPPAVNSVCFLFPLVELSTAGEKALWPFEDKWLVPPHEGPGGPRAALGQGQLQLEIWKMLG